jgi:hypothetical protein
MPPLGKQLPHELLTGLRAGVFQEFHVEGQTYVCLLFQEPLQAGFRLFYSPINLPFMSVYEIHQKRNVHVGLVFHVASVNVTVSDKYLLVKMPLLAEYNAEELIGMGSVVHHDLPEFQAFHMPLGATLLSLPDDSLARRIHNASL